METSPKKFKNHWKYKGLLCEITVFHCVKGAFLSRVHLTDTRSPTNPSKANAIFTVLATAYTLQNALPITNTNLAHHHTTPENATRLQKKANGVMKNQDFLPIVGKKLL